MVALLVWVGRVVGLRCGGGVGSGLGCRLLGCESDARVGEVWVAIGDGGARVRLARVVWVWVWVWVWDWDSRGCCYCGVRVKVGSDSGAAACPPAIICCRWHGE
jgi:hypothetical protein